jgi:hypothetical protein
MNISTGDGLAIDVLVARSIETERRLVHNMRLTGSILERHDEKCWESSKESTVMIVRALGEMARVAKVQLRKGLMDEYLNSDLNACTLCDEG